MIDYDETFSPVVKFQSITVLLAFALQNDLLLYQMDFVTAFLIQQPDGYLQQTVTLSNHTAAFSKERSLSFAGS